MKCNNITKTEQLINEFSHKINENTDHLIRNEKTCQSFNYGKDSKIGRGYKLLSSIEFDQDPNNSHAIHFY